MGSKLTTKQFIEKANKVHNKKYIYLKSNYESANIKIIITCPIIGHGDFPQTPGNHLFGQGCPKCSKIDASNLLRFDNNNVDNYFIENDIKIKRIGKYKNISVPIDFQCLVCNNIWSTAFNAIKSAGTGCPKCNDTKLTNKDVDDYLIKNKIKIKRIDDYKNNYEKINWKCLDCNHIWIAKGGEIMRRGGDENKDRQGSGCPNCARGRNERIVNSFLTDNNLINSKLSIKLPINKYYSFPDFYISYLNLIIEYNGIQHYQPAQFGGQTKDSAEKSFAYQRIRDQQLRDYCNENNINLLEIDGRKYKGNKLMAFLYEYFKQNNLIAA